MLKEIGWARDKLAMREWNLSVSLGAIVVIILMACFVGESLVDRNDDKRIKCEAVEKWTPLLAREEMILVCRYLVCAWLCLLRTSWIQQLQP